MDKIWENSTRFRLEFGAETWCDKDQIRMKELLQIITGEYKNELDGLMKGLDVVVEFIQVKYEMMAVQLEYIIDENVLGNIMLYQ